MNDAKAYLVNEFLYEYRAKQMDRRTMLRRITLILGGATAAASWLQSQGLEVSAREAASAAMQPAPSDQISSGVTIDPSDPAIIAGPIETSSRDGVTLFGYLASPAGEMGMMRHPGVLIIHENGGLTEHFRDVARRYAKEGFVGLALDLHSRNGGSHTAPDQPTIGAALSATPMEQLVADMTDYGQFLMTHATVLPGGIGVTGFCIGGGLAYNLMVENQDVVAVAGYYGAPLPPLEKIPNTRAAVLAIYGALDQQVTPTATELEDALHAAGKTYRIRVYEDAQHAFFNDSRRRYAPAAAAEAWPETLAWFRQYLPTA